MNSIYILINKENKNIWGIYNSEIFLEDKINTLKENFPNIQLEIEEKIMNTNITKKKITNPSFEKNKLIIKNKNEEKKNILNEQNEDIKNEVKRIEEFYKLFKEDLKSYANIKENKLEIPDFFKTKFNVIQNIYDNNIPDKEQFSYFASNIFYK